MRYLILSLLLAATTPLTQAQSVATETEERTIIQEIEESSEGNIHIDIQSDILEKILANPEAPKKTTGTVRHEYGRMSGYRIQVFSDGRNQHTLEARAKARGSAIIAKFPKYRGQVYTNSSSPNWYTRIGNFKTAGEAAAALEELKRAFPQYSSEMRVVKTKITPL